MVNSDLPPDGFAGDSNGPPDGFVDTSSGPPDGFAGEQQPSLISKVKTGAVKAWSAFKEGYTKASEIDKELKDVIGYDFSPIGASEKASSLMQAAFDKAGEKTAETVAEKFPNHPLIAATAGFGISELPDAALAFVGGGEDIAKGIEKVATEAGGLTTTGERLAQGIAKTESVAPASENVIKLPTGEVKILDTTKIPQPLVDKLEHSKEVATSLEQKVAKASGDLDTFTQAGPQGLSISARENEWLNRVDQMKAEHADLLKQINRGMFDSNLEARSQSYLDKLEELKNKKEALVKQYDEATLIGPKEKDLLDKIQTKRADLQKQYSDLTAAQPGQLMAGNQPGNVLGNGTKSNAALSVEVKLNALDQIEAKAHQRFAESLKAKQTQLAQGIAKSETNINEVGRQFGTYKEQSLFKLRDQAKAVEGQISEIQTKYGLNRLNKFNKQKDKLTEIAAYAENDLRNLGFSSKDIQDGFVKFVKGEPVGGKFIGAAQSGNVISKDLHDGLIASPDISGFNADFGQFTTNFDTVDQMTKGAFSREVKQDLYNKSIQSYEIGNHFLDKVNALMEKYGLKDEDGQTFTRYVEGEIQAPPGREKAFAAAKEDMRTVTDEALDLRNARRSQRGEDLIPRREDYITAAQEQAMKDDLYVPAKEAMRAQYIKKKSAEFGFDQPRQDLIPEDMRMGAFDVIKMYTTKTAREVSLSDSVEKFRALAEIAQKSKKPNLANYLNSVADRITGEAFTNAVKNMGISAEKSKVLNKAMELGGNYAANVVNQLGAGLNQINSVMLASKDIGVGRAILSVPSGWLTELKEQILKAAVNPAYESFATENSKVLRLMASKETAQILRDTKQYGPLASVNQWTFKFFNDALYKGVFNQAYKAARASGYDHSVAVKVADAVVEKSQGLFEDALKPAAISTGQHPLINLAAPIQTAIFNTFNVLKNDYVFAKMSPLEKAAAVGRFAATGAVTNAMIALATGKTPSPPDAIPFFRLAQLGIGGIFSPLVKAAQGKWGDAAQQGLLLTGFGRRIGGLQTIKTVKGAAQLLKGDTIDPRVLLFGPKPIPKSEQNG